MKFRNRLILLAIIISLTCSTAFSQSGGNPTQRSFFIARDNNRITFFKLHLKLSRIEPGSIVKLSERQIFMPADANSQAIALLNDIYLQTGHDSLMTNIGYAVCLNSETPINEHLLRFNPGVQLILFDTQRSFDNRQDWARAKSVFARLDRREIQNTLTIFWELPPKDSFSGLEIPYVIQASSPRIAEKLVPELISEFKHQPETSRIRQEIKKRFGAEQAQKLFYIALYKGPIVTERQYEYIVVFRVW